MQIQVVIVLWYQLLVALKVRYVSHEIAHFLKALQVLSLNFWYEIARFSFSSDRLFLDYFVLCIFACQTRHILVVLFLRLHF